MDASFFPKRPFDPSAGDRAEPLTPNDTSNKRRHHPFQSSATPSSVDFRSPTASLKLAAGEVLFRILCPATKTGCVIGKGGTTIRLVREETGARIRIDDPVAGCEERVILVIADCTKRINTSAKHRKENVNACSELSANLSSSEDDGSPAQLALIRVFERILKEDEERSGSEKDEDKREETVGNAGAAGEPSPKGAVVCRLLAPSSQVGCVLGRGGKIVERIRHESGAQVRIMPKDHIPACASPGDELIQITGNISAVRKALLSVSGCLQENPRADAHNSVTFRSSGVVLHGTGSENSGVNPMRPFEEEVVFKLLCQVEKVGSLIGKGGSIVRALQNETGASIKIADAAPDSDEKVVLISARENSEQRHSPAQDAVIRVHSRIAEIGYEPGATVVARLLAHPQQIGYLLGKGGIVIAELRRITGASIHVFPTDHVEKYGFHNDEVVQVIGNLQSVQDALFQITSRLRETIIPVKPLFPSFSGSMYMSSHPEMPPMFRPRHDPASPAYPSPVGFPRAIDHNAILAPLIEPRPAFSYVMDHACPPYSDRILYPYGSNRPGPRPVFDGQSSPGRWTSQAGGGGIPGAVADVGGGFALITGPTASESQAPAIASVEVVVPQNLLSHVYGENNSNLGHIRQISGAKVVVQDPGPGATEGLVVISGTKDQTHTALSLVQAFILSEQNT